MKINVGHKTGLRPEGKKITMADFNKAIKFTLQWEGGYSDVEGDAGGQTYCGITRKDNPNWVGWAEIDKVNPKHGQKIPSLNEAVNNLYKLKYWNKILGDNINNQKVAGFLFDWFVNSGYHAVAAVQKITKVTPDKVMGLATLKAINNYQGDLFNELKQARINFVNGIVKRSPSQEKFLAGWLNRINSYT